MRPLNILTWHVHGSYLFYLSQSRHTFYLPVKAGSPPGYGGRSGTLAWPDNVKEIPAEEACKLDIDCVVFQSKQNYQRDQYEILTAEQRQLPRIYIEHDPPREHPTDTKHPVDDPHVLLVHVTHFNRLMWDSNRTPTAVVEHGVLVPENARYSGELPRGIVVVNGLPTRGRRLGLDIVERVRREVPLDVVGLQSKEVGGKGEVPWQELAAFEARYRFFFNPIRYTSLGLAVCEAMMLGMPVVGLATTEMPSVIADGISGCISTDIDYLIERMQALIADRDLALELGRRAREVAQKRFGINRFVRDWDLLFERSAAAAQEGAACRSN